MFNNPLDSFHKTVAEAKSEREQLDRLLTVSTPRERLLLVILLLLLVALGSWLVFSENARSVSVDGMVLEQSAVPVSGTQVFPVLVGIDQSFRPEVKFGLPVSLTTSTPGEESNVITGEIRSIRSVPLPTKSIGIGITPLTAHQIEVHVDQKIDSTLLIGQRCSVVIKFGKQSPLEFIREKLF